jgi:site-specific DNA-adenine methylase
MRYVGSKNKISKDIVPIIQSYITNETIGYIEPFVGGANLIDKITHPNKIGYDINKYLIALLQYSQINELPETISEDEYNLVKNNKDNYPDWYVGLVGFCGGFGATFFGNFARDKTKRRNPATESINNIKKQALTPKFKEIKFYHSSFLNINKNDIKNCVIYCDIPYKDTTEKYSIKSFPYDDFYKWCYLMNENNTVIISEYNMPDSFDCIWEKEIKTSLGRGVHPNYKHKRTEK